MPSEEHTRSEYLKALLNQKKTINANDSSLLNPSISNADNVTEMSNYTVADGVSVGSTDIQNETYTPETYKDDRNWWQRAVDSVSNFISNINEGIAKYIFDPIFDAGAYLYGAISGDQEGAKNAINYDWTAQYMNVINQLDIGGNLLSGDMFTADYWNDWGDTGSAEASRENINKLHASSYSSDWGEAGKTLENIEQIGGALLPSIFLAVFTGGSSAGVQAAVLGGEIAVGAVSGFGQGVSSALNDGASYEDAGKYGAVEGVINGAITAISYGTLRGGGVGAKAATKVFGKTGSTTLATATRVLTNAGIQGATATVRQAIAEPVAKLTYDQQAWEKAYGSESATYQTLTKAGQAGVTAAAMSVVAQSFTEGGKRLTMGKEAYTEAQLRQYDSANFSKINKNVKKMESLSKDMDKAYQNLESGKWTEEQYNAYVETRLNKFEAINRETADLFDAYTNGKGITNKVSAKYGNQLSSIRRENAQALTNKFISTNAMPRAKATAFINEALKRGYTLNDIKEASFNFTSADGNSYVTPNEKGALMLTYSSDDLSKTVRVPLQIGYGGDISLKPTTTTQITNSLTLLGQMSNKGNFIADKMVIDPQIYLDEKAKLPSKTTELTIPKDVAKEIIDNNSTEWVKEYFELVNNNKGSQVIKDGDRYMIINSSGEKTAITYVDSKFKTIKSVSVIPTNEVVSSKVANTVMAMDSVDTVLTEKLNEVTDNKYIKSYGDLTHEKVISLSNSKDIVDIARKQIFSKNSKKDGYTYKLDVLKGETAQKIYKAFNTLKPEDLPDAIDEIAQEIADSRLVAISPSGIRIESTAGHKEDLVKAITGLLNAKSELSKIAKIQARHDLSIQKKNEQINAIRQRANEKLEKAYDTFKAIHNELKTRIKDLKEAKDLTNQITRQRELFKDNSKTAYNRDEISDADLHTLSMLSQGIAHLTRNKGIYSIDSDCYNDWLEAQKNYISENYESGSVDFSDDVKVALDDAVESLSHDVGKKELSLESYRAVKKFQDTLKKYQRELERVLREDRKPSAYTASRELDSYDMNIVQKFTDVITKEFGGKAGEIFKLFGYGEITKKSVIALDQASGRKLDFVARHMEGSLKNVPNGFHRKKIVGEIGGVKITKGELISAYIQTELAPVNAENIDVGGVGFRGKKTNEWAYKGEGHLEEIKNQINSMMSDDDKALAKSLFDYLNNELQDAYVNDFKKGVKHEVDVAKVEQYFPMSKERDFSTAIDKMVKGEPPFKYSEARKNDKSGLIIRDVFDILTDYIDGLGTQIYLTPKVHEAIGLFNSKDENGVVVQRKIKDKYGDKTYKYLEDLVNSWIKKSDTQSKNIVTQTMDLLTTGYTTAKLADFIRPIKNYFSYITSNTGLVKQVKAYTGAMSKEVREDVEWLIENHIYNLKYREQDNSLLKGNAPTTFDGIKGKVSDFLMTPVKKVDYAAMYMGLTAIVNDVKKAGYTIRGNEDVINWIQDAYSIFNLCNVNGDPNHQNLLNENALTKYLFNILSGAKRAQVASSAIQGSLWQQNHKITPEMKAQMDKELAMAQEKVTLSAEARKKADEALEKGYEDLVAKREARDELIDKKASKEEIDNAREEVNAQREENKRLREEAQKAAEEEARARSEEKFQKNRQDSYKHYQFAGGKSIPLQMFLKTIIAGALITGVGVLMNQLYGKKGFREWNTKDLLVSMTTNSFLNWIPVVDTVSGAVLKGYNIEMPTVTMLNELTGVLSDIYNSIKNGKFEKGAILGALSVLEGITGLPLDTVRKYIYGIMKMTDLEMAIKFNNLFYTTTLNSSSRAYNEYVERGDTRRANQQLSYIMENFKGNTGSEKINAELTYLSSQGYSAIPKSVPTYYTDENGAQVQLTSEQITQFTQAYQQSAKKVEDLMRVTEYRTATAEEKAKMIKKIYDAYYSYAQARMMKTTADSKLANLLVYTNGNVDMAKYIIYLNKVSQIAENKQKSRKELVIDYINKLKGITKQEKTLLMYLSGYSISGNSKTMLNNYLMQLGVSKENAQAYLSANNQ